MASYQYRKSHCGDKTILRRPSYLHNGISYTGKRKSLYWIRALGTWMYQFKLQWLSKQTSHFWPENCNQFQSPEGNAQKNKNNITSLIKSCWQISHDCHFCDKPLATCLKNDDHGCCTNEQPSLAAILSLVNKSTFGMCSTPWPA